MMRWQCTLFQQVWPAVVVLASVALGLAMQADPLLGQDEERIPTVAAGTPAVLFPVQAARPTAGGAWPGGALNENDVLETLEAEFEFAFGEEDDAVSWVLPDAAVRRLRSNPTIGVDPYRVAYHGLLRKPKKEEQIYEPLHTQLRHVAALFDARIVVLPLLVWYERAEELDEEGELADDEEKEEAEQEDNPDASKEPQGRGVMLVAVIDIRRSTVLWHGEIRGELAPVSSSKLLTTLALAVADQLVPS